MTRRSARRRRRVVAAISGLALAAAAGCGGGDADGRVGDPVTRDTVLERMAGEAAPRVEASAGLEFLRPPRLARASRSRIEAYVRGELEEQLPPERARALTRTYARLGMFPDTLELRPLMTRLYLSQIVGYYAPEVDTLFVREDVEGDMLRPVLVHELTHALQDQHMDLDSLLGARRGANDAATAARAAVEGHATYVMLEDALRRRSGRDVDLSELDVAGLLRGVDLADLGGAPELAEAPRVIRASLLFPYTGGLAFVQALRRAAGRAAVPLGAEMPSSTEQVLHPGKLTGPDRDPPTDPAFPGRAAGGWRVVHADGLGEFETRLFLETFLADTTRARSAAAGWDGDRYRLLESPAGEEVLVWASVWDSPADAAEFAAAATDAFGARYGGWRDGARDGAGGRRGPSEPGAGGERGVEPASDGGESRRRVRVERREAGGRPVVVISDAPAELAGRLPAWATEATAGDGGGP